MIVCADSPAPAPKAGAATAPASQPSTVFKDKDGKVYPPLDALAQIPGDAKRGAAVFRSPNVACIRCHQVGDDGQMIGPPLSVVGDKLSKPQMLDAIFNPSASILMEYETWRVKTKDGDVQEGLKVEDTADHVTLKDSAGKYHDIKVEDIASQKKLDISLMPEGLPTAMTVQEMADLIQYLSTLKNQ